MGRRGAVRWDCQRGFGINLSKETTRPHKERKLQGFGHLSLGNYHADIYNLGDSEHRITANQAGRIFGALSHDEPI